MCIAERARPMRLRRALLTDRSFGKTFATCGSSTTTLVEALILRAYFPRTSFLKSDRRYSFLNQSFISFLFFFITFSLPFVRQSGTDGPSLISPLRMRHNEQPSRRRKVIGWAGKIEGRQYSLFEGVRPWVRAINNPGRGT